MIKVAGVRFKEVGKIYYFDPENLEIEQGQNVVVETVRGVEYGNVAIGPRMVPQKEVHQPLKKILRLAAAEDDERNAENKRQEKEAFGLCQEKIKKHELDMKLIDVEFTFDNNKIIFYFTADGRVDFRELVKDLASIFRTRIELRQIGVRDEAKMIGGLGPCGRKLCCSSWLGDFDPVSIRMAKEQNLSLNPAKISGICSRLMCCLRYEYETYQYLDKQLPKVGRNIETLKGPGVVISKNLLTQTVKVLVEGKHERDREILTLPGNRIEGPRGDAPKEVEMPMGMETERQQPRERARKPEEPRESKEKIEIHGSPGSAKGEESDRKPVSEQTPAGDSNFKSRKRRRRKKGPSAAKEGGQSPAEREKGSKESSKNYSRSAGKKKNTRKSEKPKPEGGGGK